MKRGTLCTYLNAFPLAGLGLFSSLVVLVVSVQSVHYAYFLLFDKKTSHCNSRAHFLLKCAD